MYFVNQSEIIKKIEHIDKLLAEFQKMNDVTTTVEKLALERITHVIIEALLDVGNLMIDGFIMRDPGSYHDIIDILIDEKVIDQAEEQAYKSLIDLRQDLVQDYMEINHAKFTDVFNKHLLSYTKFSKQIKKYLKNELGVANAFANEET